MFEDKRKDDKKLSTERSDRCRSKDVVADFPRMTDEVEYGGDCFACVAL